MNGSPEDFYDDVAEMPASPDFCLHTGNTQTLCLFLLQVCMSIMLAGKGLESALSVNSGDLGCKTR